MANVITARRHSRPRYAAEARHWDAFDRAWLEEATVKQLYHFCECFLLYPNDNRPWAAPRRGNRRGTKWEVVHQRTTDLLAQARRREADEMQMGDNYRKAMAP